MIEIEIKRNVLGDEITLRTQASKKEDVVGKLKELEDAYNAIEDSAKEGPGMDPKGVVGLYKTRGRRP